MSATEWMVISRMERGLYSPDCPLLVHSAEICAKGYGGEQFVRCRFLNLSKAAVTAARITLTGADMFGKTETTAEHSYEGLLVQPGDCFGQEELFALPEGGFHKFTVSVEVVCFDSGEEWEKPEGLTVNELPRPRSLPFMGDLLDQYRLDLGCRLLSWRPQRHGSLWMCGCGAWNQEDAPACCDCGCTLASQDPLPADDELRAHLAQRREAEKQEAERQRLLKEEERARKREEERLLAEKELAEFEAFERMENRKRAIKRLVILLVLALAAAVSCWPHIRVLLANTLHNQGNTELAAKVISFLPGFDYASAGTEDAYFRLLHDCAMARAAAGDADGAEAIYRTMSEQNAFPAAQAQSEAGLSGLMGIAALEEGDYARAVMLLEASEAGGAVHALKSEALSRAYLGIGDYYNAWRRMAMYAGDDLAETAAVHPGTAFMHQVHTGNDAATIRLSSTPTDPALPFVWDIHPQENGTARLQLRATDADSIDPLDFSAMEVVSFDRTSTAVYANLNTLAELTMAFAEAEQLMAAGDWAAAEQLLTQKGAPFWWQAYAIYARSHTDNAAGGDAARDYRALKHLSGEDYGDASVCLSNAGVRYARVLTESGEYEAAVTVITESVSDPAAAFDLAMALYKKDQFVHTITVMRTIADHPGASECINNCSELLTNEALDKGDYPAARIHAAGLTPGQLQTIADQLLEKDNTAEALWYYQQADQNGSCTEQIHACSLQLARACLESDDADGAALLLPALTEDDVLQLLAECIAADQPGLALWCTRQLTSSAARIAAADGLTAYAEQLTAGGRYTEAYDVITSPATDASAALIANTPALSLLDRVARGDYATIALGLYEQDGSSANGPEPIYWLPVKLEGGVMTLLSRDILAYGVFATDQSAIASWETALTRNWTAALPDEAFTGVEAALLTEVDGEKATLLTWEEAFDLFPIADAAAGTPTAAASKNAPLYANRWWTRTAASNTRMQVMPHNGSRETGYLQQAAPTETCGIRPAIHVDADQLIALLLERENGMQLLTEGRWDEAAAILAGAGDAVLPALSYARAIPLMEQLTTSDSSVPAAVTAAYSELETLLAKAGDTLDARARLTACRYDMGLWHEHLGNTEEAIAAFTACGSYQDAESRLEQLAVQQAGNLLDRHEYVAACTLLSQMTDSAAAQTMLATPELTRVRELMDTITGQGSVYLGQYEQDGDVGTGTEPIEWLPLRSGDGSVTLISRYILDYRCWNDVVNTTVRWEGCSLRAYLNGEFLEKSFTAAEREVLLSQTVASAPDATWNGAFLEQDACTDTVSLLSVEESCDLFSDVAASSAEPTAYARPRYPYTDDKDIGHWWLRDMNSSKSSSATMPFTQVLPNRTVTSYQMDNTIGVRPVIVVSMDHLIHQQLMLEEGIALMQGGDYAGALDKLAHLGPAADSARQYAAAMLTLVQLEDGMLEKTNANLERVVDAMARAGEYRDDTQLYRIACDLARMEMDRGNYMDALEHLNDAPASSLKTALLADERMVFLTGTLEDLRAGKTITFGHFNQDSSTANGSEPVEWLLVEDCGDHVTLLSRYILTYRAWHSKNVTSVRWSSSTLSQWLNSTFMSTCFTTAEQGALVNKRWENATPTSWGWVLDQGSVTQKVTLMSLNEALTLYGSVDASKGSYTSRAYSDYIYNDKTYTGHWWLRSMADEDFDALMMPFAKREKSSSNSSVSHGSMTNQFGVRPMIALDLDTYVGLQFPQ